MTETEECPDCHVPLDSNGLCPICGYTLGASHARIESTTTSTSTTTTSMSTDTVTTRGTIPPEYALRITEKYQFAIDGRPYQIENLDENMNNAFRELHEAHFHDCIFNWHSFTEAALTFLNDNPNDYVVHDNFFENFTIVSDDCMQNGKYAKAIDLWKSALKIAYTWEEENQGIKLHKGTPYFYLARIYREIGDLDLTFLYTYNAIKEDQRSVPNNYKERPAYMYASLVDDARNLMYNYVSKMKKKIEDYIGEYQTELGSTFSYADFEGKFLLSDLEDVVHFFVYSLEMLIKHENIPERILENDFSKLKNLDTIFNLCMIVDKVLEEKFHTGYLGGNLIELIVMKTWGRRPHRGEKFRELFDFDTRCPPNVVVPFLLNEQGNYDNNPMDREMQSVVLVWYLRNFGGHHIQAQDVLTSLFPEIVQAIMYALFISVETM